MMMIADYSYLTNILDVQPSLVQGGMEQGDTEETLQIFMLDSGYHSHRLNKIKNSSKTLSKGILSYKVYIIIILMRFFC